MKKPLLFARDLIASVLKPGMYAVDATCGNGHDTAFLAELVGESGSVLAADIQPQAIENTRRRLADAELLTRVILVTADHADLDRFLDKGVDAVMFNLGYLPGGSHSITTTPETTTAALAAAIKRLNRGGVITLVVYTGHPGGEAEYHAIRDMLGMLPQSEFTVLEYRIINQANCPPLLLAVSRH